MATIELRDLNPAEFNNNLIVYGRLGVGTGSPSNALHIYGDGANGEIKAERSSGAASLIQAQASLVRFGATSNHNLQLISNNNTQVTITTAGRLGVGTTSPNNLLHLEETTTANAYVHVQNTTIGNAGIKLQNSQGQWTIVANDRLRFIDDDSGVERMSITSAGKVGIGTTSPDEKLHVKTTSNTVAKYETSLTSDLAIELANSQGSMFFGLGGGEEFAVGTDSDLNGSNSLFVIKQDGKVGIGTTSPASTLHLKASPYPTLRLEDADSGQYALIYSNNDDLYISADHGASGGSSKMVFNVDATERMAIDHNGNVGIGMTPGSTYRLYVSGKPVKFISDGSASNGAVLELVHANNDSTDVVSTLTFANNVGAVAHIQGGTTGGNTNGYISFLTDNAGTSSEKMRILANGNVGINETTPTEKLHVDGNLKVTGDVLIGSTATSITEVGPYDPYVLYHWSGRTYQNGGASDIMFFNGDALYYADADSPWNKSSVAAANPESLTTLVGGATFNRSYQTRDWYWHHMIRLDNTTKTDSAMPTKYMRIKMPVYYTAGASEHHVFYFQVLNDRQTGFQLCVCNSSGTPVKRAAVQHKNGGGWATYGSYQRGPNNSVANQSSGYYGEWTNSLIMGSHIDDYSFADSDSPTGRSIYLSINCSTANSNNYIYFMGFAIGKNKKGIAITTPKIIVNGANDPTRGKVNLYGTGLRHHSNWYWSEMAYVHQQHASTTPIQIAGTDKDIIINFMNTGHSDHEFDKVTLFLTDKDSVQRYATSGGGNFGWDSHVPNQWVNAGLMNIGSFTGNGADKWAGYSHRGGISLSWIIKKELLQALAYDVDGITNLRVGFGNVNNHWRHGYIRGIATEQINS